MNSPKIDNHRPEPASDWAVFAVGTGTVAIFDLDLGNRSVTNDAASVCRAVHELHPGKRIVYRDSGGDWAEMVHEAGLFKGFRPWGLNRKELDL